MKKRLLRYGFVALLVLIATGCQKEEYVSMVGRSVKVMLNLSAAKVESRAAQPMIPANENPIYDLWVLQFDGEGIIVDKPQYHPCSDAGELFTTLTPELRSGESTVCVIANLGPDFEFKVGGRDVDNLTAFRTMLIDAPLVEKNESGLENVGHLTSKNMYMYGYFQGAVTEGQSLNIMLGRLFLRVNLVLKNNTGTVFDKITVKIDNVPTKTHIPFVNEPLEGDIFTSYEETIVLPNGGLGIGESMTRYYYMPENIRPSPEKATTVTISANGRTASVALGNDVPGVTDRDYTLSRNNIYTFNLKLYAYVR